MSGSHRKDHSWETDLIWYYFHEVATTADPQGSWYGDMDPLGELSSRHRVYELLVDEADQTNANTKAKVDASKIPWNQNNAGFLKTVNNKRYCGSLIKIVFMRYMRWRDSTPISVKKAGFDAAKWTIDKLKAKSPVRASLGGHHYVGIVGHRCMTVPMPAGMEGPAACSTDHEFLCIEPWSKGVDADASIIYAGTETGFLGIIKQVGTTWTYGRLVVTTLEG